MARVAVDLDGGNDGEVIVVVLGVELNALGSCCGSHCGKMDREMDARAMQGVCCRVGGDDAGGKGGMGGGRRRMGMSRDVEAKYCLLPCRTRPEN